jgi:superfamily I DNA/RNA helicase/RecB family exonuclease
MASFSPDPDQRRVLEHARGPLLVSGGFGSGKTAVLRERFARLLERGADPERVALVVGSRRARDEARDAVLERLEMALPGLTIVTMHGLANHVVGQRFGSLGYDAPPTILSAAEQFSRVRELLAGEDRSAWPTYGGLLGLRGFADEVRQLVIRAQEALLDPDGIDELTAGLGGWKELARFYRSYLDVLDANGEIDFAGLLVRAASAAALGEPAFDHVLVDDHQDATLGAESLLDALRPETLVVGGNLGAHVFSFQGTSDAPLRRLADRVPVVELRTAHRPPPGEVRAWRAPHPSEEHAAVARELRRIHVEEGTPWDRLAVVVRRFDVQAHGVLRALDDARIPRTVATFGRRSVVPATRPFELALDWLVADPDRRDALAEPLMTSELGRTSPATARTFFRLLRAHGHRRAQMLEHLDLIPQMEGVEDLERLRETFRRAEGRRASVLDAFRILWTELAYAAELVSRAGNDEQAAADLDEVVAFSRIVEDAAATDDGSVEAFLRSLDMGEGGPELAERGDAEGSVHVLSAHATAGREFETVVVVGALEGNFPSLTRPEPMFDLEALSHARSRSEVNRDRLAEERRLFSMVLHRARRRLLVTATDPHGDADAATLRSRFLDELELSWADAPPSLTGDRPISVDEAGALWRRIGADPAAGPVDRAAALQGLLALGEDPGTWWFQRGWTIAPSAGEEEPLRLSYSRLDTLENCELQYVLSTELGLDPGGGHQAWVGRLIHRIIEDVENGVVERSPAGFDQAIEDRWDRARFPSFAISEAELANAKEVLARSWFERFDDPRATAVEQLFEFELDGAMIRGKIDRIGPVRDGGTRITDYKTGRSDNAGPADSNLQLAIYYLAVNQVPELAELRPIEAVELAFLGGKRGDPKLDVKQWTIDPEGEADYQQRTQERISALIARVRELRGSGEYVANTAANCFFCRFQPLCTRYAQGGAVFPIERSAPVESVREVAPA